ncbi:hypothetical protein K437DRAFT_258766 [Tilletiaria anomala UBC 951]|uniref:Snf7-domain-containing protein n=1 Tax=Tilletiaria anomala (strain ATCC 24038 / CBS 436.72 / UBC 951) TaxID=1037660 RepID=A0A066VIP1_TILAU|nr:uncharacterized protein K437DRAFT_258766 [Tilletiaria anomala UBC 951]KDN40178.1 hypothetical protein K437DRAFT_258766 [Tilletiaria anomala UBC 951]
MSSFHAYLAKHRDFQDRKASSSRLHSLYSDLSRHKNSNPASFRANIEWWRKVLTETLKGGIQGDAATATTSADVKGKGKASSADRIVMHVNEDFKEKWTLSDVGRPLGLGTVILELANAFELVRASDFMAAEKALPGPSKGAKGRLISPTKVASSLAMDVLTWALAQLGVGSAEDDEDEGGDAKAWKEAQGDWVCWEAVDEAAQIVLREHYEHRALLSSLDSLYTKDDFQGKLCTRVVSKWGASNAGSEPLSARDLDALLKHLQREYSAVSVDNEIVKFALRKGEAAQTITLQDKSVVSLRETHMSLERQIVDIGERIQACTRKIKEALCARSQEQAKSYLRSRKLLEELLLKRTGTVETLGSVLVKIEQAAGDAEIVAAYELSATTLKKILSDPSLQVDRVENTMQKLSDAIADQQEIQEMIRSGVPPSGEIDEEEIMKELETLEQDAKSEEPVKRTADTVKPMLPQVPASMPEAAKSTSSTINSSRFSAKDGLQEVTASIATEEVREESIVVT